MVNSRRLKSDTAGVLDEAATFLGLAGYSSGGERPLTHVGRYEQQAPAATSRLLREFYRPHNQRLYQLINHDFG